MRPFEILTLILATGSFVALKTHQKRKVFLYLLFTTSLCSILQYYFEGIRWQFIPVTYSLPLMYVFHKVNSQSLSTLKSSFLIFMLVFGFILSSTIPVFQLPNPGGPHKIGTHTFHSLRKHTTPITFRTACPCGRKKLGAPYWDAPRN